MGFHVSLQLHILVYFIQSKQWFNIWIKFPANGEFKRYLFTSDLTERSTLDWGKRFEIIFGIARGVLYVHQDSRLKIIHKDLKVSNVLLDAATNPKFSNFGMARLFGEEEIQVSTKMIVGT